MITTDGKCDGKCNTCNIVQQMYCKLTEQNNAVVSRLENIEKKLSTLDTGLHIAQGGDGAEKVSESINLKEL